MAPAGDGPVALNSWNADPDVVNSGMPVSRNTPPPICNWKIVAAEQLSAFGLAGSLVTKPPRPARFSRSLFATPNGSMPRMTGKKAGGVGVAAPPLVVGVTKVKYVDVYV